MARCAVYQLANGLVVNVIIAEAQDPPPDECGILELTDGQACDIGWTYAGGGLTGPAAVED